MSCGPEGSGWSGRSRGTGRQRWRCLGIGAYRMAFGQPKAAIGRQPAPLGDTAVWVLPNPSGLNANHQLPDLARAFGELRDQAARRRAG